MVTANISDLSARMSFQCLGHWDKDKLDQISLQGTVKSWVPGVLCTLVPSMLSLAVDGITRCRPWNKEQISKAEQPVIWSLSCIQGRSHTVGKQQWPAAKADFILYLIQTCRFCVTIKHRKSNLSVCTCLSWSEDFSQLILNLSHPYPATSIAAT